MPAAFFTSAFFTLLTVVLTALAASSGFFSAFAALAAAFASCSSFCIIIAICELLGAVGDNRYVTGALVGIKAAATGMIAYSAYKVGKTVLKDSFCWVLAIAAFVLIVFCGVNAVWVILAGIAAGLARGALKERSEKGGEQK